MAQEFAVAVTEDMAALIDPDDDHDPIAAQFVPIAAELAVAEEELADPIGDQRWSPVPGIVHRHRDRVLLKPTLLCPVYCRFCFRREMVGKKPAMLEPAVLQRAYAYIRERPEIWEVIVTGGDPFVLAPRRLAAIVRVLDAIPHLGVIRFHTRVPVVDPGRVTAALVAALTAEKAVYVVVHANHPRELTAAAKAAVSRLVRAGIPVLGQTVLLRGVNDDAAVLEALFRRARGNAGKAVLPAPCRSRPRHRAFPHGDRRGTASRALVAHPRFRAVPADLCARHSRRLRQGAARRERGRP